MFAKNLICYSKNKILIKKFNINKIVSKNIYYINLNDFN